MGEPPCAPIEGVTITKAKADDIPFVKAIVIDAYSKYVERIGKEPAPMKADYYKLLDTHDIFVLKTDTAQTIVGSIVIATDKDSDSIKINNLVVDSAAQGRGYGRLLMNFAEESARSQGIMALTLFTNIKMHENLALYPKMGFVETERRTESGYERVYFRKDLLS
ncbi:acyl-CoA N-acyltransferase [Dactylonectria estremocensis]|uniref:Acyl-CoA N-acyltransferase n=1 Tax=Dactylonectria estremocensis TaxID=1079267 RepID=A0A9P9EGS2_9HYPO|nr:acyl-CoA N-acyltransferase [Dactylonectria estremocensis]